MKTQMIEVNLQEGLFLKNGYVVGAWCHHLRILIAKHPCTIINDVLNGLEMDEKNLFEGYKILDGKTDSFSLNAWNPQKNTHTALYEFCKK